MSDFFSGIGNFFGDLFGALPPVSLAQGKGLFGGLGNLLGGTSDPYTQLDPASVTNINP